jgi:aspartyl-tRNA(Asn)/glutamyl-tRNA(Gln) amidotransferase subunit B
LLKHSNEQGLKVDRLCLSPEDIWWLAMLIEYEVLDRTKVSKVIDSFMTDTREVKGIITELKLWPTYNDAKLKEMVISVISDNPKAVEEIRQGKKKAIGFLIGQLKRRDGNIDTREVMNLIEEHI